MSTFDRSSPVKLSCQSIREKVDERHWQLFETRLKNPLREIVDENYTRKNDYHIIDRLKPIEQFQTPVEPHRHWIKFSSQLTNETNERARLVSLFRKVWLTNWNSEQIYEIRRTFPSKSIENTLKLKLNAKSKNHNTVK